MTRILYGLLLLAGSYQADDARSEEVPARVIEVPGKREGGIRMGRESATVVVRVFTDYTCPHCGTLHGEVLEAMRESHVEPGKVVLEIRHLPRLDEKSLGLVRAALAADRVVRGNRADAAGGRAAVRTEKGAGEGKDVGKGEGRDAGEDKLEDATESAEEGKTAKESVETAVIGAKVDWRVWEFQKALFEFAGVLPEKAFPALAGEKGIDEEAFRAAWDAVDVRKELLVDADLAEAVGLKSLPATVVAPNRQDAKVAGVLMEGEVGAVALAAEIEKAARTAGKP